MSFIEHPEGASVLTQQPEGKQAGRGRSQESEGGDTHPPPSLPVLEELLEDGTLSALGQNLHLQWEKSSAHRLPTPASSQRKGWGRKGHQ